MLALVFIVAPVLRGLKNREELFLTPGKRLSFYGTFLSLGGLLITGLINIHYLLGFSQLLDLSNPYTKTLWNKLFAFFCVVGVSLAQRLF